MAVNKINYKCNGCRYKGIYMCTCAKTCTDNSGHTPRNQGTK